MPDSAGLVARSPRIRRDTGSLSTAVTGSHQQMRLAMVGIGAQKAGTSWLFRCLAEHPEIEVSRAPESKELNFFNHNYDFGYDWLHQWFSQSPGMRVEFTTRYLADATVPARVHRYNPEMKLVVALRDPVDRALSHHQHEYGERRTTRMDFWEALDANPAYIEYGMYWRCLQPWLDRFPQEQIHTIIYDDIVSEPDEVIRRLYSFAGMDRAFLPRSLDHRVNPARDYRSIHLDWLKRSGTRATRAAFGERAVAGLRRIGVGKAIAALNEVERSPSLRFDSVAIRPRLTPLFADDIQSLAKWLGRDLTGWTDRR